jgi:hypothetical protein
MAIFRQRFGGLVVLAGNANGLPIEIEFNRRRVRSGQGYADKIGHLISVAGFQGTVDEDYAVRPLDQDSGGQTHAQNDPWILVLSAIDLTGRKGFGHARGL